MTKLSDKIASTVVAGALIGLFVTLLGVGAVARVLRIKSAQL